MTLFTYKALARLFADLGLRVYPTNAAAMHLICREPPAFAQHMLRTVTPIPV